MTIKTFQPWNYGTFFMYYDITGPFAPPDANVYPNEKGGFFGSVSLTLSLKSVGQQITGKKWNWGGLDDFSLRTELEHVSKFGSLMYYGVQFNFKIPRFDFVTALASIRDDWNLRGVDLQLGMAQQPGTLSADEITLAQSLGKRVADIAATLVAGRAARA